MPVKKEYIGTGRRKRAIASVRLRPSGSGKIDVNGRLMDQYFPLELQRKEALAPFTSEKVLAEGYDLVIRLKGGGIEAQACAIQLGLARALVEESEERRQSFKALGYLTRDPRRRERKKYGRAGARKGFQFSKR